MRWLLRNKSRAGLFVAVHALVLAQVAWWAWVFTRDADIIAALQKQQLADSTLLDSEQIHREARHRKLMFWSESAFFAMVISVGLWALYRALRQERHSKEMQRALIEIVSHESKTPLTALKLRLEALRDTTSDSEVVSSLNRALDEVRRLTGVVEKTLDLNRTERQALRFELVYLAEVVESVVGRVEPWLQAKGVELELVLDPDIEVKADFSSLQSSVQNLVENAVLYNPRERKQLRISLQAVGPRAVLTVQDDGPGVAEGEVERIFERFYRGKSKVGKTPVSGTGLGLYLARVIVEAHRGILRLVRTPVGACFQIDLPRRVVT